MEISQKMRVKYQRHMAQNWNEHRMRNAEKTTKRTQISTKEQTYIFIQFFLRNSTKYQENSKKHTVKTWNFSKNFWHAEGSISKN